MKWQYAQAYVEALAITLPKQFKKQKGSLAKTMALHVRHDFWYISPTFSAKHDIKKGRLYLSKSRFLCES